MNWIVGLLVFDAVMLPAMLVVYVWAYFAGRRDIRDVTPELVDDEPVVVPVPLVVES